MFENNYFFFAFYLFFDITVITPFSIKGATGEAKHFPIVIEFYCAEGFINKSLQIKIKSTMFFEVGRSSGSLFVQSS